MSLYSVCEKKHGKIKETIYVPIPIYLLLIPKIYNNKQKYSKIYKINKEYSKIYKINNI